MLIRYIRACCPQQAIDEYTADAWHDVLSLEPWLTLAEARRAVAEIKRRQPFADISEIIAQAKAARAERRELEASEYVPGRGQAAIEQAARDRENLPDPLTVREILAGIRLRGRPS